MNLLERLSRAEARVAQQWRATQPPEKEGLFRLVQEARFYIWRTGQVYRFIDYLECPPSRRPFAASASWSGEYGEDMARARDILSRIRDAQASPGDKNHIQIAIDILDFILSSGQQDDFYDYLKTFHRNPPPVIARFDTHDEAETWLESLSAPPSTAHILIGNEYFDVFYSRERNVRVIDRHYTLERFIEAVTSRGLPEPVATFATLAEAEAWWANHPNPPISTFVQVAGEHYLAIHHRKIAHRSLHPVSILKGWQEEKKRIEELEKAQQEEPST